MHAVYIGLDVHKASITMAFAGREPEQHSIVNYQGSTPSLVGAMVCWRQCLNPPPKVSKHLVT